GCAARSLGLSRLGCGGENFVHFHPMPIHTRLRRGAVRSAKIGAILALAQLAASPTRAQWNYPPTRTVEAADTYFGKTYKDPYRWLENLKDKEVEAWFKEQAALTQNTLAKIPGRKALVD